MNVCKILAQIVLTFLAHIFVNVDMDANAQMELKVIANYMKCQNNIIPWKL